MKMLNKPSLPVSLVISALHQDSISRLSVGPPNALLDWTLPDEENDEEEAADEGAAGAAEEAATAAAGAGAAATVGVEALAAAAGCDFGDEAAC